MKKILLPNSLPTLYFSMLLAIGLLSACSSDDDGNPFVGEWQLMEARAAESGKIIYPSDKSSGTSWFNYIKFLPNLGYEQYLEGMPIKDSPIMTYHYNKDVLTVQIEHWGYYSYKYSFSEKGNQLSLTDHISDINPGFNPQPVSVRIFKKIK